MPPAILPASILVVEDEAIIGLTLMQSVQQDGYLCALAGSVPEAIDLIGHRTFDAAILDVNIRGLPVYPVAELLRSRGVPFLFTTTAQLEAPFEETPVLRKPYLTSDVLRTLADVLPDRGATH